LKKPSAKTRTWTKMISRSRTSCRGEGNSSVSVKRRGGKLCKVVHGAEQKGSAAAYGNALQDGKRATHQRIDCENRRSSHLALVKWSERLNCLDHGAGLR